MSLWSQRRRKREKMRSSNSPLTGETSMNKAAQMQRLPFAMTRKVADVFVVMEGEVPDSILKNNIKNEFHRHTSNFNTHNSRKSLFPNISQVWWSDSTVGKAVTCTVSSCMGHNHRPSNCTNNYLRPKWVLSPHDPAAVHRGMASNRHQPPPQRSNS